MLRYLLAVLIVYEHLHTIIVCVFDSLNVQVFAVRNHEYAFSADARLDDCGQSSYRDATLNLLALKQADTFLCED